MLIVSLYCIFAIVLILAYFSDSKDLYVISIFGFVIYFSIIFLLRSINNGTDYHGYIDFYNRILDIGWSTLDETRFEFLFKYSIAILSLFFSPRLGIAALQFLGLLCFVAGILLISNNRKVHILCLISSASFFLFYNLQMNILRNGVSCFIFIFSVSVFMKRKLILGTLLLILSIGYHNSAILYYLLSCIILVAGSKLRQRNILLLIFASTIISYFNISELVFSKISAGLLASGNYYSNYNVADTVSTYGYKSGFRPDFIIFTLAPIIFSYYYRGNVTDGNEQKYLNFYFKLSSLSFCVYLLMDFILYSDRLLVYSWMINIILLSITIGNIKRSKIIPCAYVLFLMIFGGVQLLTGVINTETILS